MQRRLSVRWFFGQKVVKMSAKNKKSIQTMAETLSKRPLHFSKSEIECLIRKFSVLMEEQVKSGKGAPGLEKEKFMSLLFEYFGMTKDLIMGGVFRTFDKNSDGYIDVEEWVDGLSVSIRGTLNEKMKYCFCVYDYNGDGHISREEMFHMLKDSVRVEATDEDPVEIVKDLVDITLKKMDHDRDGRLSFEDFRIAVRDENLLLEAFGTCLPDSRGVQRLEQCLFQEQHKK